MQAKLVAISVTLINLALIGSLLGWLLNYNRAISAERQLDEAREQLKRYRFKASNADLDLDGCRWNLHRYLEMAEQCIAEKLEVKRGGR